MSQTLTLVEWHRLKWQMLKRFYIMSPVIKPTVIIIFLLMVLLLFLPQIASSSLQLFPHLQVGHLLNSLIVGRVDGGDALDVEARVLAGEVLPGDGPGESYGVGLHLLSPSAHALLYGVGNGLKAGYLTEGESQYYQMKSFSFSILARPDMLCRL